MNLLKNRIIAYSLLAALGLAPIAAQAESAFAFGGGATAAARLDLRVVIPTFLYFRVGTTGGTIDMITFSPTAGVVGDSTSVSGLGGDAGGSGANVVLRSNGGQVTITETNDGGGNGLNGTGTTNISLAEITATSDDGSLDTPTLSDSTSNTSTPTLNSGTVTNRSAVWTYAYDNTTVPEADTYNVEITYTAVTP